MADSHGPAGNVYDKYGSRNPLVRALMAGFFRAFDRVVADVSPQRILEVGCGEGEITGWLARRFPSVPLLAADVGLEVLALARARRPEVAFLGASVYSLPFPTGSFDLVVASEMLEHLAYPEAGVQELCRVCGGTLLVSVPREPVWCLLNLLRGRYWRDGGNTPGHRQRWSKRGIVALLRQHANVEQVRAPLPWTVARCSICRPACP